VKLPLENCNSQKEVSENLTKFLNHDTVSELTKLNPDILIPP
jgi:hypothetical protein